MSRIVVAVALVGGAVAVAWLFLPRSAPTLGAAADPPRVMRSPDVPLVEAPVAAIALRASSRVVYVSAPDRPHLLDSTFGEARARLDLRLVDDDENRTRLVESRLGERVARLAPGEPAWIPLEGSEREATLRRMELRRAALAFPQGFAWSAPGERADERPGSVRNAPLEPGVGHLEAVCDAEGRAERVAVFDASGREQEALRIRTIQTIGDSVWPRDVELEVGGVRVWAETVLAVQTNARFRDEYFAPTGGEPGAGRAGDSAVIALGPMVERRVALAPADRGWRLARERAEALIAQARAAGLDVESAPALELSLEGEPTAVLLRLRAPSRDVDGYESRPERTAVSEVVAEDPPFTDALARLARAAREAGARTSGAPYVRVLRLGGGIERYQLVWVLDELPR